MLEVLVMQISGDNIVDQNSGISQVGDDGIMEDFLKAPFIHETTLDKFCLDWGKFQCISHRSYMPCLDFDQTCNNTPDW